MNTETEIKDFVIIPRKLKDDYLNGKLTKKEFDVLVWIFLSTNPYNGYFSMSYEGLVQDFRREISNDSARKLISSLHKKQYIHFINHKGRGGSFPIYPIDFKLTNGRIQTLEYIENKPSITTQPITDNQIKTEPNHNQEGQNHNLEDMKKNLINKFSMDKSFPKITTPYNDNDNKNKKKNIDYNFSNKSSSFAYKKSKVIPVESFSPKSWEEEQCWDKAKELGETDMRFLLSCLRDYGINHIERAWGIFKDASQDKIQDKPKYFNKLIRNLDK